MSTANVTRREFLKITVGAGAGLVLGSYLSGCSRLNSMPFEEIKPGAFSPNVFVGINPDNTVTVVVPRAEMGQGVRTALPMIVAEELDVDWSSIRVETAPAGDDYGNQETGGSTSVSMFWHPLRQAGATARAMLVAAAAQQWDVAPEDCTTENGLVIHRASARQLSYGELATAAAQLPVPEPDTLNLKAPKDFRLVGQSIKRVDDPGIVTGRAIYGLDFKRPYMLYAVIARSPVFWGQPNSFDAAAARAVDGVIDVFEIKNAVAVVAENTWAAIKGREALEVTWDEGEMAGVSSDGIRAQVLARLPSEAAIGSDEAQSQAKGKLSVLYEIPNLAHAPMEPMNCVADARADRCEVWAPTQNPQQARAEIFSPPDAGRRDRWQRPFTGWSKEAIKVNVTLMGGGFGRRLSVDYVTEAVRVSKAIGRPVQVVWTREDDIRHDWYHPLSFHHVSANLEPLADMEQQTFESPVPIPWGAWRSVQHFTQAYVQECFVDELAAALDRDPLELRLARIKEPRLKHVLELAAAKADWGSPLPAGWGRGLAAYTTWGKTPAADVVELEVDQQGRIRVQRVVCAVDCGLVINPDMVKAQIEGGIVFALTAALKSKITIKNGRVEQSNFHNYPILKMDEMPAIEIYLVPSSEAPQGVGEMSGPPLTPAVANAVFAATGKRIRHIPIVPEDLRHT